ncbi:MAG TPA: amino acid racemase [Thermaerobacter sp.]
MESPVGHIESPGGKTIGILGGMGPEATVDLFAKIVRATPARVDQDHVRVVIDNNPKIPDRTAFLRGEGPDPVPAMLAGIHNLVSIGADLILIPCNTAHVYYERLQAASPVPILHIMREVARVLAASRREGAPVPARVGLLATELTVESGLYHRALAEVGIEVLVPEPAVQDLVTKAIFGPEGIKAGSYAPARSRLLAAGRHLVERGAQALIAGCTELPIVLRPGDFPVPLIDPAEILARAALREVLGIDVGGGVVAAGSAAGAAGAVVPADPSPRNGTPREAGPRHGDRGRAGEAS